MAITSPRAGRLSQGQENFFWLVADKLVRLVAGVFVGMLVARYLGPGQFGLFAYADQLWRYSCPLLNWALTRWCGVSS